MKPGPLSHRTLLWAHLRVIVATIVGLSASLVAHQLPVLAAHRWLIGWDLGAIVYLALLWRLFLTADADEVRSRASVHDENSGVLTLMIFALLAVSLGAVVAAMLAAKGYDAQDRWISAGLTAATLALGWLMLHSVFAARYAHRHYVEIERDPNYGFGFPGEPPGGYGDFFYLAFSVGATFQVSDNTVGSSRLRKLVTIHAAVSYVYNTAILAVGVSLLAGLVSA